MAPKIREDLVVPYKHVPAKPRQESTGMITQSLPMAAMFMRNKLLSWSAFFLAVQSYLNEPINAAKDADSSQQPPLLRVVFAFVSLATCYMDIAFPNTSTTAKKATNLAAESLATAVAAATGTS